MNKIGIFFFSSLKAPTGASTVLRNILLGFDKSNKFSMEIFALDSNNQSRKIAKGFLVVKYNINNFLKKALHFTLTFLSKYSFVFSKYYVYLKYHRNAKTVIQKNIDKVSGLDILFFHDIITPYEFKDKYFKEWKSKKKVIVLHTNGSALKMLFDYFPLLYKNTKTRKFYKEDVALSVLNDMDKIILLSELAQRKFAKIYPELTSKTEVVQNGVNKRKVSKKEIVRSKLVFTTVGTVCKRKGHDILIDAILEMSNLERAAFEFNIIGDGKIKDSLEKICNINDINNVNFLGVSYDVDHYLESTDCFVLASRDEGLPMAIIEAMSFGIPIIASNVGGVPDLVYANVNGYLISPANSSELKNSILDFINCTKQKKIELGENSRKIFNENFTQSTMIDKYKRIFKDVLMKKG